MKLNAVQRKFAMSQTHDFARVSFGSDLEAIRQRFTPYDQGMITRRLERLSDILENVLLVVANS